MRKATVGRGAGGALSVALSNSLVGISTSTDPTLYGPVCAGNAGVGLIRFIHVISAAVWNRVLLADRREGIALTRDLKARGKDSVAERQ